MFVAFCMILLVRLLAICIVDLDLLKRRVVVIGVGEQAARIEYLSQSSKVIGFICVGYIDYGDTTLHVPSSKIIPRVNSLLDFVRKENIDEVVVALEDRRQNLPSRAQPSPERLQARGSQYRRLHDILLLRDRPA